METTLEGATKLVVIHVNERPVRIIRRVTGLGIKQAAIEQGVPIQIDFVLSQELADRRTKIIGDGDLIEVNEHSRFVAVAPDDNS
jgi:Multiubiquitin